LIAGKPAAERHDRDSTALPENSLRDIIALAFQSAGKRLLGLRSLYLGQKDIEKPFLDMRFGAWTESASGQFLASTTSQ